MTAKAADAHTSSDIDEVVTSVLTASRLLVAISAKSLAAVEETLTLPQFRMLVLLESRGDMNISRLGEHLDVNPSTAMRMVDRLSAAGMVLKDTTAHPGRAVTISLSTAGRRVVRRVTERRRAELAKIIAAMPAAKRQALVSALDDFSAAGGEPNAGGTSQAEVVW